MGNGRAIQLSLRKVVSGLVLPAPSIIEGTTISYYSCTMIWKNHAFASSMRAGCPGKEGFERKQR
jgi:hypothetical protein